ncbi:MAG: EAL domain-containing protein [Gammaproteobacteria bacterium]|nr:EAL domain-containing protein [Gammaproteobacteria bacterium]
MSVNKYGADNLGIPVENLIGRSILETTHPDDAKILTQKLQACVNHPSRIQRCEFRKIHKYGDVIWIRATMRLTSLEQERHVILVTCEDISEARILSEQLEYQANHDALTGLINRVEFEKRMRRVLSSDEEDADHALCYLDLDQFKIVNDTCGHLAGDELLRRVGDVLNTVVRKRDTLARMGGDEFAVLLEHCPLAQAKRVASELLRSIESLRFTWEGKRFVLGVSIGLVPMRAGSGSLTDILSAADEACYAAKDSGRNRVHVYYSDDAELSRRRSEMEWVSRINQALEEDLFCLHAQSIGKLQSGTSQSRGNHYEILLRMRGEEGELIYPGDFLPEADRYNLSEKIDQWVVEKTLEWLTNEKNELDSLAVCCINLSGQSMSERTFLDFILRQFKKYPVPAEKICFEITETSAIDNFGAAMKFIKALKDIGCLFALDDFGTGVSSFNYLKNLPVDFLKIDGSFIKDIDKDPIDYAMVRSINEIGQVMGKETIAEFVETDEILEVILEIGINYAQGYTIGKPVAIEILNI